MKLYIFYNGRKNLSIGFIKKSKSLRQIAKFPDRSSSTISKKVKRNYGGLNYNLSSVFKYL